MASAQPVFRLAELLIGQGTLAVEIGQSAQLRLPGHPQTVGRVGEHDQRRCHDERAHQQHEDDSRRGSPDRKRQRCHDGPPLSSYSALRPAGLHHRRRIDSRGGKCENAVAIARWNISAPSGEKMGTMSSIRSARSVSVRDVAALAQVAPTTVSNVLSGNRPVSQKTRERVLKAIDELGYRPNLSARNLRLNRTGLIAVAVPEIDVPYFSELIRQVVQVAREHSYTVLIDQTEGRKEAEDFILNGMNRGIVDGILFSPLGVTRAEFVGRSDDTPMVLLGERMVGHDIDHVGTDNVAAAADATRHLIERGRSRIAAIGDQKPSGSGTASQRTKGYRKALRAAGIDYDPALVMRVSDYHRLDGARAMAELLDSGARPDAVFGYTDLLALGAMHTVHERGLRVPDDIAIIGMDDIDEGRYSNPTLTTVAPDKAAISRTAFDLLLKRIADHDSPPHQVVLPHSVNARGSS